MGSARRFRREALKGLRLWRVPHFASYLIIYRPINRGIEVLRVLHGARHIEQLLGN
jgi:toxin ParE1/3/4